MNSLRTVGASLLVGLSLVRAQDGAGANPQDPSPAAAAYLTRALDVIEQSSIKVDTDWAKLRQTAFETAGAAVTTADTYAAIRGALASLGDRHSFFVTPAEAKLLVAGRSRASTGLLVLHPEAIVAQVMPNSPAERAHIRVGDHILAVGGVTMPDLPRREFQRLMNNGMRPDGSALPLDLTVRWRTEEPRLVRVGLADFDSNRPPTGRRLEGDVGYIELPGLGGGPLAETYADTLHAIQKEIDAQPVSGWIVDLRRNIGGNMWPMLAGIGPIVGEGRVGGFSSSRGVSDWTYEHGVAAVAGHAACTVKEPHVNTRSQPPVAVLTSGLTASSGEAVLVAFRGRADCRSFGGPTRGVPTANQTVPLEDGAMLVLTVSLDADRTGRTYDDSLAPDQVVAFDWTTFGTGEDPVLAAALRWLQEQPRAEGR